MYYWSVNKMISGYEKDYLHWMDLYSFKNSKDFVSSTWKKELWISEFGDLSEYDEDQ